MDFSKISISLASHETILGWSFGEVLKSETLNFKSNKPENGGLFCQKIFGPIKDWTCACGKYKNIRFKGITCEKCGVDVVESAVRRSRMGHIILATNIVHFWFREKIRNLLGYTQKELAKITYCNEYLLFDHNNKVISTMSAEEYRLLRNKPVALTGGDAILKLLQALPNIETNRPEWMILSILPIISPDLRPLVPLDEGRYARNEVNDFYRMIIARNNRLKRLMELNAPELVVLNERRILQEAIDGLFDNKGKIVDQTTKRPLKSIAESLKGKHGRFRRSLLGKRVDYSGRAVIVVGPELKLHQCGIPKTMALELFKPYVIANLLERRIANSVKSAKKLIDNMNVEVWNSLEEVIYEFPVILNRAPTLHRLSMQAFEIILVEGKAIRLHPLVCNSYNADFDGDQMATHIPISLEAQIEARTLMFSTNNILSPASGEPVISPSQDIILGIAYLTKNKPFSIGEGMSFANKNEVSLAYELGEVGLHAEIKIRIKGIVYDSTVGRVLLYDTIPYGIPFEMINKTLTKKDVSGLLSYCYKTHGNTATILLADAVKDIGFKYMTQSGISISVNDMIIPSSKKELLEKAEKEVSEIQDQYANGLLTEHEKRNKAIDVWSRTTAKVTEDMMKETGNATVTYEGITKTFESFNPIYMMANSGARGNTDQMKQLAGMRGLMTKPSGEIIETPITSNFREGLSILDYYISTHGSRKGLADTALKTASSGYLTRRLVDASQNLIVREKDCGSTEGLTLYPLTDNDELIESLSDRVFGRYSASDIIDDTGELIVKANEEITRQIATRIKELNITKVKIRSAITCLTKNGVCSKCYGRDLARGNIVAIGEAVGIVAAQSIGEPGTQLTMRTFHIGGIVSNTSKKSAINSKTSGVVKFNNIMAVQNCDLIVTSRTGELSVIDDYGMEREKYQIKYGYRLKIKDGQYIEEGTTIAEWDAFTLPIIAEADGIIEFKDCVIGKSVKEMEEIVDIKPMVVIESNIRPRILIKEAGKVIKLDSERKARYYLPTNTIILVKEGMPVKAGDILAKIPTETSKTKDITGGLPKINEIFESRTIQDKAFLSEISGTVSLSKKRSKTTISVTPVSGESVSYVVSNSKHIFYKDGDKVVAGDQLTSGQIEASQILKIYGKKEAARFLIDSIQKIYRYQGVKINDKHIELIVSQMLKTVRITEIGDSNFSVGEIVNEIDFITANAELVKSEKNPASGTQTVIGITKAALNTGSVLASASFQDTVKVLTNAALNAKTDELTGLKENIITGRLIPVGTGFPKIKE